MDREKQSSSLLSLISFDIRAIVAGSRKYADYFEFSQVMHAWTDRQRRLNPDASIVFITGCARTGADAMIIRWCKEHSWPWHEMPAAWDDLTAPGAVIRVRYDGTRYNVKAGFDRNTQMAQVATHVIGFWDGKSPGTRHMLTDALSRGLDVETFLIDTQEEDHHGEPECRASRRARVYRETAARLKKHTALRESLRSDV